MKTKISTFVVALALTGCATTDPTSKLATVQNELRQVQEKNDKLQDTINQSTDDLERITTLNKRLEAASNVVGNQSSEGGLLPPNAKPGECYARVLTPALYQTESRKVLQKEVDFRIEVIPATYEYTTDKVLVKEASEVADLVPARYEWRTESVLVKDAVDQIKTVPAVYESSTETVLVKAAYTTWKKGRGPIEKLNNSTGEIMCLVEVPAEYRTVTSRVVKTPASTKTVTSPAIYNDVKKRVMIEGPTMIKRPIPAEYKTIKIKKVLTPARESRIEIPAIYQTVTKRVKVADSVLEWRSILCETNTTGNIVRNIQKALTTAGYHPGPADGVLGGGTMRAIQGYQKEKNLAVGQLTLETIKSLGVSY